MINRMRSLPCKKLGTNIQNRCSVNNVELALKNDLCHFEDLVLGEKKNRSRTI